MEKGRAWMLSNLSKAFSRVHLAATCRVNRWVGLKDGLDLWAQWSESPHLSLVCQRRSDVILGQGTLGSFLRWMRGETRANWEMVPSRGTGVYAKERTTLWRELGTLLTACSTAWAHVPGWWWCRMVPMGCWAALTAWSCSPAHHCSRSKHTRMSAWTVYPVPGLDPSGLPCWCHVRKGNPRGFQLLLLVSRHFLLRVSPAWSSLLFINIYQE